MFGRARGRIGTHPVCKSRSDAVYPLAPSLFFRDRDRWMAVTVTVTDRGLDHRSGQPVPVRVWAAALAEAT